MGEFDLIAWIRARAASHPNVMLGIGDDCASLKIRDQSELLVTTDMLMEGRHFRLESATPEQVGYKALAVNLSDIAAMAGEPLAALVAVALPKRRAIEIAQQLHAGMAPLAHRFGVAMVGGDTNAWDGRLVISVTMLGQSTAKGIVRRSGARAGDAIFVTGPLGGSLLGRHLTPKPRVEEALAIHCLAELHAMIDISDGLASDLWHILKESGGLGAILDVPAVPIHTDAVAASQTDGLSPLDHALNDGEDFELCFTVSEEDAVRLVVAPPEGISLFRIGTITKKSGLQLRRQEGSIERITPRGFDHLRDKDS